MRLWLLLFLSIISYKVSASETQKRVCVGEDDLPILLQVIQKQMSFCDEDMQDLEAEIRLNLNLSDVYVLLPLMQRKLGLTFSKVDISTIVDEFEKAKEDLECLEARRAIAEALNEQIEDESSGYSESSDDGDVGDVGGLVFTEIKYLIKSGFSWPKSLGVESDYVRDENYDNRKFLLGEIFLMSEKREVEAFILYDLKEASKMLLDRCEIDITDETYIEGLKNYTHYYLAEDLRD